MTDSPEDFDPESTEEREVGRKAAGDSADFFSLMSHVYRGELGRATSWRTRIDRTTNWAVVLTASLLTWTFSTDTRPHYVLVVGMIMLIVFLGIEARRYRIYDIWRSRVRILEANVFANALDPQGAEQSSWRRLLSEDLREPTIKTPATEAIARRLRRVYFPLLSVLGGAWLIRLTVFAPTSTGVVKTAAVGGVPGAVVILIVGAAYGSLLLLTFWPGQRQAKGELKSQRRSDEWK